VEKNKRKRRIFPLCRKGGRVEWGLVAKKKRFNMSEKESKTALYRGGGANKKGRLGGRIAPSGGKPALGKGLKGESKRGTRKRDFALGEKGKAVILCSEKRGGTPSIGKEIKEGLEEGGIMLQ